MTVKYVRVEKESFSDHIIQDFFMFNIIQTTVTHKLALIDFTIFTKFQENILPDKYSITVFMNHNESSRLNYTLINIKIFDIGTLAHHVMVENHLYSDFIHPCRCLHSCV